MPGELRAESAAAKIGGDVAEETMAKMGRPTIPAKERSSKLVGLRLTPEEYRTLKEAARAIGLTGRSAVGKFIRFKLGLRKEQT